MRCEYTYQKNNHAKCTIFTPIIAHKQTLSCNRFHSTNQNTTFSLKFISGIANSHKQNTYTHKFNQFTLNRSFSVHCLNTYILRLTSTQGEIVPFMLRSVYTTHHIHLEHFNIQLWPIGLAMALKQLQEQRYMKTSDTDLCFQNNTSILSMDHKNYSDMCLGAHQKV